MGVFQFIGRSIFPSLLGEVQNPDFLLNRHRDRKISLLAALVCHLVRNKKRVIYIPRRLVLDARECLRNALLFTFHDNRHLCETISNAKSQTTLSSLYEDSPNGHFTSLWINATHRKRSKETLTLKLRPWHEHKPRGLGVPSPDE